MAAEMLQRAAEERARRAEAERRRRATNKAKEAAAQEALFAENAIDRARAAEILKKAAERKAKHAANQRRCYATDKNKKKAADKIRLNTKKSKMNSDEMNLWLQKRAVVNKACRDRKKTLEAALAGGGSGGTASASDMV